MVTFDHVSFQYESCKEAKKILNDLSFHIEPESFTALIGPSGCGKSTIFSLISGYLKPQSGSIIIDEKCLKPGKIGYMMQSDHLLEWRSVYKNILLGLELQKKSQHYSSLADELLKKYRLFEYKDKHPSSLSGGMRQRISLIRTLVLEPYLLLLDEPFSALDYQTRLMVSHDIYTIIKNEKKTAILVTHDIAEAVALADRIIVLSANPCHVKKEFTIDFEKKGITRETVRNTPLFQYYFDLVWEALQNEE